MRILVTGGAGYIGSHFCKVAATAGHELVVLDDLSMGHGEFVKWGPLIIGDIRDTALVRSILKTHKIEAVVHFAAKAVVSESVRIPELYDAHNRVGTKAVLTAMAAEAVPYFVLSSSCATYGLTKVPRLREDHPQRPVNPYGQSKLDSETAVFEAQRVRPELAAACLRYFNVIGHDPEGEIVEKHEPETHVLPNILKALRERRSFQIFGTDYPTPDGTAVRDYVDVNDLGRVHLAALEKLKSQTTLISNVGAGRGHSVREVFDTFARVVGKAPKLEVRARREGDPPSLVADDSFFRTWYEGELRPLEASIESLLVAPAE